MISTATIQFTVVEGQVIYNVPEKVHRALQLLSEMESQQLAGSITLHTDSSGKVAKVEQKTFF